MVPGEQSFAGLHRPEDVRAGQSPDKVPERRAFAHEVHAHLLGEAPAPQYQSKDGLWGVEGRFVVCDAI